MKIMWWICKCEVQKENNMYKSNSDGKVQHTLRCIHFVLILVTDDYECPGIFYIRIIKETTALWSFDRLNTNLFQRSTWWHITVRDGICKIVVAKIYFSIHDLRDKLIQAKGQQLLRLFKVVCIIISILNCWIVIM